MPEKNSATSGTYSLPFLVAATMGTILVVITDPFPDFRTPLLIVGTLLTALAAFVFGKHGRTPAEKN